MLRVVLAERCPTTRRGLRQIVEDVLGWRVHAEAPDAGTLRQILSKRTSHVRLLILDILLPGIQRNVPVLAHLIKSHSIPGVLVYTADAEADLAVQALRSGVSGWLHKDAAEEELVAALKAISQGEKYIDSRLEHTLALSYFASTTAHPSLQLLSARERQVFEGLADGKKLKDIATDLALHPKTISSYRTRIFQKLPIKSNADIVRLTCGATVLAESRRHHAGHRVRPGVQP
jgi:two-component system, NarL family, invasion response regulator UvrY